MPKYRVAIDIGGTFTDIVAQDMKTGRIKIYKVLTNPNKPEDSFMAGLLRCSVGPDELDTIIHATTLGTNLFLGQMGLKPPKAILITNRGFRDIIEIGRQNRPELYNLFFHRPRPLVSRKYRLEISGRIDAYGDEIEPLNTQEIREIAKKYCGEVEVFIISLLNSYVNPTHEKRVKEIIREVCGDAVVVASYEVDPRPKEYERTVTTIINAILIPILSRYLDRIRKRLRAAGYNENILVMRSSGGVSGLEYAINNPASFIESGPAAGALATAYYSRILSIKYALGLDMGGTTAKASAIIDGSPLVTGEYEVGGTVHMGRIVRGSGYPLRIPHIDLAEVSSGGGTIAWVDPGGALRVGPISAGADPGPACYGRGGDKPTITDAHMILGRLPPALGGGEVKLNKDAALESFKKLADQLGTDVIDAAYRVLQLANEHMAKAIRIVTLERGMDPKLFKLFAFGGAGPLHAADLMTEGMGEAIIPLHPGVFSALGLLYTDYKYDFITSIAKYSEELDDDLLRTIFNNLIGKGLSQMERDGLETSDIKIIRYLEMRYWGQAYEMSIPYNDSLKASIDAFHELHMARYGYMMQDERIFIVSARIEAIKPIPKPRHKRLEETPYKPQRKEIKEAFFGDWYPTNIYDWSSLRPGAQIDGPAIVYMEDSTLTIPPGYSAYVDGFQAIHLNKEG